jgi:hypothetical protein
MWQLNYILMWHPRLIQLQKSEAYYWHFAWNDDIVTPRNSVVKLVNYSYHHLRVYISSIWYLLSGPSDYFGLYLDIFQCQNCRDKRNASNISSYEVDSLSKLPSPFSTAVRSAVISLLKDGLIAIAPPWYSISFLVCANISLWYLEKKPAGQTCYLITIWV